MSKPAPLVDKELPYRLARGTGQITIYYRSGGDHFAVIVPKFVRPPLQDRLTFIRCLLVDDKSSIAEMVVDLLNRIGPITATAGRVPDSAY